VKPKIKISTKVGQTCRSALKSGRRGNAALPSCIAGFTLVEILVVVVLMSLIVLALMAVFNSTQAAFRASLTQTDVLEGGRSVIGLVKADLEGMTPSFGQSNVVLTGGTTFPASHR
jgi:prepilin-type N-terminal cleavage/methylation domain-containing protein